MAMRQNPMEGQIETANRSFILLGKVAQGKSSLANLIVGCKSGRDFPKHNPVGPNSVTREVSHCNTYAILQSKEEIVIDILDQCEFNDPSISLETHKNNLIKCILNANAKISVNYLIVIDLSRPHYEHEQYYLLATINEWLTNESYTFSDNAVIVFTHKDVLLEEYIIVCEYCYPQEIIDRNLLCDECYKKDEPNLNTIRDCKRCSHKALAEGRLALRHHEFGQQCQIKCDNCENGTDHPRGPCESCLDNKLYSILTAKRNTEEWKYINETLDLIPKFIIINTLDMSERIPVLRQLVDLTTPTLNILFHGNDDFSSKKIKTRIKKPESRKPAENPIKHKGFNLDFCYNPDYLAFKPPKEQLHANKVDQMNEGLQLVNSLSVIMIMINLSVPFGNALNNFILSISKDYKDFNSEEDWRNYAVLIFHIDKTSADVSKIVRRNGELKALVKKVNNRYIIMQDATSKGEFLDSVTRESIKVKQINKGKDFVNREVVQKMLVKQFHDVKNGTLTESKFYEHLVAAKGKDLMKKLKLNINDNVNIRKMATADYTSKEEFLDSVTRECLKVKQNNKGRDLMKMKIDNANIRKMTTEDYSTRVVFIHGNSNFPSSLLFKHTRNKINHSTYYTTNYNNKTLKFFFQPDILSYNGQKYDINHDYATELPNMAKPLLVNYFILISYNNTYTPAMHKEITNIPNLYGNRLSGKMYVIILAQNINVVKDIKNLKKNKDLAALINNYAENRYGIITENNMGYYKVHIPERKKNDLEDTLKGIMSVLMQDDLYYEIESCNKLMEAMIPNNYTMDANIQHNYEVKIPTKQIVRSFIIIGDDKNVVANFLNDGYKEKDDYLENKPLGIDKSTNDERGFEIISVRGLDNADIAVKDWYENLKLAIKDSNPCINHSFLIVFNLSDEYVSYTRVETLNKLIKDMNKCETYRFDNKVVVVFTYNCKYLRCTGCNCKTCNKAIGNVSLLCNADKNLINGVLSETIHCCQKCEEQKLNTILIEKLNTDKWGQVNSIVNLTKEKLLINLASPQYENKDIYISRLIEFTKPMIKMIILGNTDFSQNKIREKLNCEGENNEFVVQHEDFGVWLLFENDFVKYKSIEDQCNNAKYDIVKIVKEDKANFDGITIIVFLINLNKELDHAMRNYIEKKIPPVDTEEDLEIWKNVVFLFEAPEGVPEANINSAVIYKSKSLNEFAMKKADNKYVIINEQTTGEDLINKLVQLEINMVFAKNKGKETINHMLTGMIQESIDDMNKWSMSESLIDFESETCPDTNV